MENAVKEEQKKLRKRLRPKPRPKRGRETIRLSGEDVQKLKEQVREDHFGVKGKKRGRNQADEERPLRLWQKNDDDDF